MDSWRIAELRGKLVCLALLNMLSSGISHNSLPGCVSVFLCVVIHADPFSLVDLYCFCVLCMFFSFTTISDAMQRVESRSSAWWNNED